MKNWLKYPSGRLRRGGHQNSVQAGFVTKEEDWK